ncbi:MAG: hypothetical protein SGARI_003810, partial [Bacillariaceae sp.]
MSYYSENSEGGSRPPRFVSTRVHDPRSDVSLDDRNPAARDLRHSGGSRAPSLTSERDYDSVNFGDASPEPIGEFDHFRSYDGRNIKVCYGNGDLIFDPRKTLSWDDHFVDRCFEREVWLSDCIECIDYGDVTRNDEGVHSDGFKISYRGITLIIMKYENMPEVNKIKTVLLIRDRYGRRIHRRRPKPREDTEDYAHWLEGEELERQMKAQKEQELEECANDFLSENGTFDLHGPVFCPDHSESRCQGIQPPFFVSSEKTGNVVFWKPRSYSDTVREKLPEHIRSAKRKQQGEDDLDNDRETKRQRT